jgi:hypothetical protein
MRLTFALVLVTGAALAAALTAAAKNDVVATLTTRIPLDAPAGARLRIAWKLQSFDEHGVPRPFGGGGIFVRLVSRSGGRTETATARGRPGRYAAIVRVPDGGIGGIRIGIHGWTDAGGGRRADVVFPIANDPFVLRRASRAFAALVARRYGNGPGYRGCAPVDYSRRSLLCTAEIHRGRRYRAVDATAVYRPRALRFTQVRTHVWTRRWRRLPTSLLREFRAPGAASVNAPDYDWGWLVWQVAAGYTRRALPASYVAVDGATNGLPQALVRFRCAPPRGGAIVCRNALGDALSWTPRRSD